MLCLTCFSSVTYTFWGPICFGVCRDERNPNDDDEGQHVIFAVTGLR